MDLVGQTKGQRSQYMVILAQKDASDRVSEKQ